jgi:putative transcriptional regulator
MIDHSHEGALGVVLNRVSDTSLQTVWESVCESDCVSEQNLFVGGPVEGPLMALHTDAELDGVEVLPGLFFTSEKASLEHLVEQVKTPFRIFTGYAGWGPGQLDAELRVGGWLVAETCCKQVLGDDDELWQHVTHRIGAEITNQSMPFRHIPADPRSN